VKGARCHTAQKRFSKAAEKRLAEAAAWPVSKFDGDPIVEQMEQFNWALDKCEAAGLDWLTVNHAIHPGPAAEVGAVERLSEALLERLQKAPFSEALANFVIARLIEQCAIPTALKRLVRRQLKAERTAARKIGRPGAYDRAVRYATAFPMAGVREIARYARTNPDTVARWKRDAWRKIYRTKRQP
jgi:hypothetical protein